MRIVLYMETYTATAAAQTDANLWTLLLLHGHGTGGHSLRDQQGNLREFTDAEAALGKALRAEAKRRGMI